VFGVPSSQGTPFFIAVTAESAPSGRHHNDSSCLNAVPQQCAICRESKPAPASGAGLLVRTDEVRELGSGLVRERTEIVQVAEYIIKI